VPRRTVDPDAPAMCFDYAAGDRETETDAATVARSTLPESLKQLSDLLVR